MQRLRTVTSLDVSAVAGHHAMPAALLFTFFGLGLACQGQRRSCHTKNQLLPNHLRKKRVKVRSTPGHYATKKRPVKIIMHLGLENVIKFKFTTNFDRCAILNVLNCLTKNFEPL